MSMEPELLTLASGMGKFVKLVAAMRGAQKNFVDVGSSENLLAAGEAERAVDAVLVDIATMGATTALVRLGRQS